MNFLQIKKENDRLYAQNGAGDMRSEYCADFTPVPVTRKTEYKLSEHTVRETTVECIIHNAGKKTVALNFANALAAGGAYVIGGSAQEESLCRASFLYYTIKETKAFYSANRRHILPDYTHGMIYSENVRVIRDDSGQLLPEPVICSFITCPAVNRYEAVMIPAKKLDLTMEQRIERIVSFAESKAPEVIILGAFGCGAFGNKREKVLPMFERAINRYTSGNAEIIFAIP